MHDLLTCWKSEFLLVMLHYGFRNASASEKLQITVKTFITNFSHIPIVREPWEIILKGLEAASLSCLPDYPLHT